jgi:hypothetical protein
VRKPLILAVILALGILAIVPAVAFGDLTNEYGLHFAGQATCTQGGCHSTAPATVHSRMAKDGLVPAAPAGWTNFRAAGDIAPVAGTNGAVFNAGGSYSIAGQPWCTLGDLTGGSATEYLFWNGSASTNVLPWNLVEGLAYDPVLGWEVGSGAPTSGLYDVTYSCQRCHMLGATVPQPTASPSASVPNPAASITATPGTARQWARDSSKNTTDFITDPTVSKAGFGIQCESCHGTGQAAAPGVAHFTTGVKVNIDLPTMGDSQVCGQCHGSFTNVANTLGIYGYTPNRRLADFVDINGVSGGQSYTKIPSESEFLASPTAYFMFPNGSNAKGGHYYYNEWAASAHSYRPALTSSSADAMAFQAGGGGSFVVGNFHGTDTYAANCTKCHTGEVYLKSKNAPIATWFTPAPSNVGFMGQECATCHSGHPSAVGAADVVREPDKAGNRSATGLLVDNASICEDCHNWQYEVLGTTPVFKPMASLSGHGSPSHPQRETLHGRSMLDVAPVSEFMPNVKCEECHMVKTNKTANRISHGMKPMLPGNADKWMTAAGAAYQGQDSCSKCHAGQTRTQLQANIDAWQTQATNAATAAASAITAVTTASPAPAEYSLTDSSKPGYVLIGRATWNYKVWENDASGSVHNPQYVLDGLVKATEMAKSVGGSFEKLTAPASIVPGGWCFVAGKIVNGDTTAPAGATLKLKDGSTVLATTTADSTGAFAFLVAPATAANYTVVWVRSDNPVTDLVGTVPTINVVKTASKTTIKASAASILVNHMVKLTGKVTPSNVGGTVTLQYRKGTSGAWKSVVLTLGATSNYVKSVKLTKKGAWYFKTSYAGTATVAASKSATVKVVVK